MQKYERIQFQADKTEATLDLDTQVQGQQIIWFENWLLVKGDEQGDGM